MKRATLGIVLLVVMTGEPSAAEMPRPIEASPVTNSILYRETYSEPVRPIYPDDLSDQLADVQRRLETVETGNTITQLNNDLVEGVILGGMRSEHPGAVLLSGAGMLAFKALRSKVEGAMQDSLRDQSKRLYRALFETSRRLDQAHFDVVVGGQVTKENVEAVSQLLFGQSDSLVAEALGGRPNDAEALIEQRLENMNDALHRLAELHLVDKADLEAQIGDAEEKIADLREDLEGYVASTGKAIDTVVKEQTALKEVVDGLASETARNSRDIAFIQDVLWNKMPSSERLKALKEGGFFPDMEGSKREQLVANLEVLQAAESFEGGVAYGQAITRLAGNLGLISTGDAVEVNRQLETAKNVVNLGANLWTGNWFAALGAANGLFGGGSDPTAAQSGQIMAGLKRIQEQLDTVISLNYEILRQIEALSVQLESARQDILEASWRVSEQLDELKEITLSPLLGQLQSCDNFASSQELPQYGAIAGVFPSYDKRAAHFLRAGPYYFQCLEGIEEIENRTASDQFHSLLNMAGARNDRPHEQPDDLPYAVTLSLTEELLNAAGNGVCLDWLSLAFMTTPRNAIEVAAWPHCAIAPATFPRYRTALNRPLSGRLILKNRFYVPLVLGVAWRLHLLAPYRELLSDPTETPGIPRLRSAESLSDPEATQRTAPVRQPDPIDLAEQHFALIDAAIAQQGLLSGSFQAHFVLDALAPTNFGSTAGGDLTDEILGALTRVAAAQQGLSANTDDAKRQYTEAVMAFSKWTACPPSDQSKCDEEIRHCRFTVQYLRVSCAAYRNRYLAANLGVAIGFEMAHASGRYAYAAAYSQPHAALLDQLLQQVGIARAGLSKVGDMWGIALATPLGSLRIDLPISRFAWEGTFVQPSELSALHTVREALTSRVYGMTIGLSPEFATDDARNALLLTGMMTSGLASTASPVSSTTGYSTP